MRSRKLNSTRTFTFFVVALAAHFAACSPEPDANGEGPLLGSTFEGTGIHGVVSSGGAALSGVEVIVMHRKTHEEVSTFTNEQGIYELTLEDGPYDIGFFSDGYAEWYEGPVVVEGAPVEISPELKHDAELEDGTLYGTVLDWEGHPLPGVTVHIERNQGTTRDFPHGATTTTAEDGTFTFDGLPEKSYYNLVFKGEGLDEPEVIDLVHWDGPCMVRFDVNHDHDNGWFAGMGREHHPVHAITDSEPDEEELPPESMFPRGSKSCTVHFSPSLKPNGNWYMVYGCGTGHVREIEGQKEIVTGNTCPINCWSVRVAKDGAWSFDYAIHTYNTSFTSSLGSIDYTFTDTADSWFSWWDEYSLGVTLQGEHVVNYDSSSPNIKKVHYTY